MLKERITDVQPPFTGVKGFYLAGGSPPLGEGIARTRKEMPEEWNTLVQKLTALTKA